MSDTLSFEAPAHLAELADMCRRITDFLEQSPLVPDDAALRYDIELAFNEVCVNIITHAYAKRAGTISVTASVEPNRVVITTEDHGRAFDPDEVPSPDLESGQIHGYGLFLLDQLLTSVEYKAGRLGRPNRWRLEKRW